MFSNYFTSAERMYLKNADSIKNKLEPVMLFTAKFILFSRTFNTCMSGRLMPTEALSHAEFDTDHCLKCAGMLLTACHTQTCMDTP